MLNVAKNLIQINKSNSESHTLNKMNNMSALLIKMHYNH